MFRFFAVETLASAYNISNTVDFLMENPRLMCCTIRLNWCDVEWLGRKPNCSSGIMLFISSLRNNSLFYKYRAVNYKSLALFYNSPEVNYKSPLVNYRYPSVNYMSRALFYNSRVQVQD